MWSGVSESQNAFGIDAGLTTQEPTRSADVIILCGCVQRWLIVPQVIIVVVVIISSRHSYRFDLHTLKNSEQESLYNWWLLWSHLSGCFWIFAQKFWEVVGTCERYFVNAS